jgi:hypothetical protein
MAEFISPVFLAADSFCRIIAARQRGIPTIISTWTYVIGEDGARIIQFFGLDVRHPNSGWVPTACPRHERASSGDQIVPANMLWPQPAQVPVHGTMVVTTAEASV